MKKIGVLIKRETVQATNVAKDLILDLINEGLEALVLETNKNELDGSIKDKVKLVSESDFNNQVDATVVIGGDGTFLRGAELTYGSNTPILGINLGHLGFLTEVEEGQITSVAKMLINGDFEQENRAFFEVEVSNGSKIVEKAIFVNETAIHREADSKMVDFSIYVADKFVTESKADGVIISSPTGSTAYNLSAGGPILYPTLDNLVISPICPHNLSFRPVVIPSKEVKLQLNSQQATLSIDGRKLYELKQGFSTTIKRSKHNLIVMHPKGRNFFDILRKKLHWSASSC